jgi:hypothetical protein
MMEESKGNILAILFVLAIIGSFVATINFNPLSLTLMKPCEVQSNPIQSNPIQSK